MGKCKVNSVWFDRSDSAGFKISSWCRKHSATEVFCIICGHVIKCEMKGFQAITQHVLTTTHANNAHIKLGSNQLLLTSRHQEVPSGGEPATIQLYNKKEATVTAELLWALKNVVCNMSASSCDGIVDTFRAMFPGSVPDGFSLGSTKLSYLITEALGPYFRKEMLADIGTSYYTLQYDETLNAEGKKELQTMIRYWSTSEEKVVVQHLESFFMGHSTSHDMCANLKKAVDNASLQLSHMIMLASDGPAVNTAVWNVLNEELKALRGKGLLDLGTCNIHKVHNAFMKGLQSFGEDSSELVSAVYDFFKGWPSRHEDLTKIQQQKGIPQHNFIKHVPSRWLTLRPAALRLLEQWEPLKDYFLQYVPMKQKTLQASASYKVITSFLKSPTMKAEMLFVISFAELFEKFCTTFQAERCMIHLLYPHLKELLFTLMARFMKGDVLAQVKHNSPIDEKVLDDSNNFLPLRDMEFGQNVKQLLSVLSEKTQLEFFLMPRRVMLNLAGIL